MKRMLTAYGIAVAIIWIGFCRDAAANNLNAPVLSAHSLPTGKIGTDRVPGSFHLADASAIRPYYRFNRNGTVTDLRSGLIWQQADDGQRRTWQDAVDYCADLTLGGHSDWRLPTRRELYSIKMSPAKPTTRPFPANHCWSGSSLPSDGQIAWVVLVGHGYVYPRNKDDRYYVRCVR